MSDFAPSNPPMEPSFEAVDEVSVDGLFGAVILRYRRADALADGALVEVSDLAREAGFTVPVAVTAALFADIAAIPEESGQDETGRLWDVLSMARFAVYQAVSQGRGDTDELRFGLFLPIAGRDGADIADVAAGALYVVKSVIGPGDAGEPTLTLLKENED